MSNYNIETSTCDLWVVHEDFPKSMGEVCWLDFDGNGNALIMYHNSANYPEGGMHTMPDLQAISEFELLLEEGYQASKWPEVMPEVTDASQ